ncbi:STAS domain-containing protein [Streptomyces goshikiensis]|uniref:STAS domain-containing protein n=1 Tax=Streptomyces goshikiensis TaxID=1942 RepID=UPI003698F877
MSVPGELDVATAPDLRSPLGRAMAGCQRVTIDLADLQFCDCCGMSALLATARTARAEGSKNPPAGRSSCPCTASVALPYWQRLHHRAARWPWPEQAGRRTAPVGGLGLRCACSATCPRPSVSTANPQVRPCGQGGWDGRP